MTRKQSVKASHTIKRGTSVHLIFHQTGVDVTVYRFDVINLWSRKKKYTFSNDDQRNQDNLQRIIMVCSKSENIKVAMSNSLKDNFVYTMMTYRW